MASYYDQFTGQWFDADPRKSFTSAEMGAPLSNYGSGNEIGQLAADAGGNFWRYYAGLNGLLPWQGGGGGDGGGEGVGYDTSKRAVIMPSSVEGYNAFVPYAQNGSEWTQSGDPWLGKIEGDLIDKYAPILFLAGAGGMAAAAGAAGAAGGAAGGGGGGAGAFGISAADNALANAFNIYGPSALASTAPAWTAAEELALSGAGSEALGTLSTVAPEVAATGAGAAATTGAKMSPFVKALVDAGMSEGAATALVAATPALAGLLSDHGDQTVTSNTTVSPAQQGAKDAIANSVTARLPAYEQRDLARADQMQNWAQAAAGLTGNWQMPQSVTGAQGIMGNYKPYRGMWG